MLARGVARNGEVYFEARRAATGYRLGWPRAGSAILTGAGSIARFTPARGAKGVSIRIVRRMARAYADSLAGKESLHATALARGGRAVAILGASGAGKSTFAAALLRRDPSVQLITDDLLYVRPDARGARIRLESGAARLKLARGARERLGLKRGEADPNFEKEIVEFPSPRGACANVRLTAFVLLARGRARLRLVRLRGARAALALLANIYNELLRPPRVVRRQFSLCAALAAAVPVYRLHFPGGWRRLPAAARRVERLWTPSATSSGT